jgi:hypothetical protein
VEAVGGSERDGLLPGEPASAEIQEDATFWASVYAEMLEFVTRSHDEEPTPEWAALAGRLQGRFDFWRQAAGTADAPDHQ